MTASGVVKADQGNITGILVSSSSSLVLSVYDDQAGSANLIVDSLATIAATPYPIPAKCNSGIYVKVVSGSGSFTVFYD